MFDLLFDLLSEIASSNRNTNILGIIASNSHNQFLIHIKLKTCTRPKHIEVPIFGVSLVAHKVLFLPPTKVLDRSTEAQLFGFF